MIFLLTRVFSPCRYAGFLLGITNTFGTIPGVIAPIVTGYFTKDVRETTQSLVCHTVGESDVILTLSPVSTPWRAGGKSSGFRPPSTCAPPSSTCCSEAARFNPGPSRRTKPTQTRGRGPGPCLLKWEEILHLNSSGSM